MPVYPLPQIPPDEEVALSSEHATAIQTPSNRCSIRGESHSSDISTAWSRCGKKPRICCKTCSCAFSKISANIAARLDSKAGSSASRPMFVWIICANGSGGEWKRNAWVKKRRQPILKESSNIVGVMHHPEFRYEIREHIAFCFSCISRHSSARRTSGGNAQGGARFHQRGSGKNSECF